MSFGFSISDFITVGQLAWKIYDRCKASAAEFRDLSREVSSMHFVLKAIEKFWGSYDLAPDQRYELSNLVDGCKEALKDLESKLDKYQRLGSNWKSQVDRFRWAATIIAPLRTRLMHNAIYLSTFNATLASSSHSERIELSEARILQSEATILHKLNELQLDFQEGKRGAPAFSLVTLENFTEEETWESITKELQNTDIDNQHIASNQGFIRSWVSQIVLADVEEEIDLGSEVLDRSRRSSLDVPPDERLIVSPTVPAVADVEKLDSRSTQFNRQDRTNSHQVKDDHWRPINGPNPKYVQKTLKRFLNFEYNGSEVLPIKHVYNQIDWRDRGYLFRHEVESHYAQAISDSSFSISNQILMEIISTCDTNRDGRIDHHEFVQISQKLLQMYKKLFENRIRIYIEHESLNGGRKARLEREWLAKAESVFLPWPGYEIHLIDTPTGKKYLNSTSGNVSAQEPCSDPRSFTSMAFTAAKVLLPRLCYCLERLIQKQAPGIFRQSLESVIDATSVFTVLEGEHGPTRSSDLDEILAFAHSISLQDEEMGARPTWLGLPCEDLKLVQEEYYGLLRPIQGFLCSLQSPTLKELKNSGKVGFGPSLPITNLQDLRLVQMPGRANEIQRQAAVCRNLRKQIQDCRESTNGNTMAKKTNVEERKALAEVRTLQLTENASVEHPAARLHTLSADGLKKTGKVKGRVSTFVEVRINGEAQSALSTKVCPKTITPRWDEMFEIVLGHRSTLSFELFDIDKESKRRSLALISDENPYHWPSGSSELPGNHKRHMLFLDGAVALSVGFEQIVPSFITAYAPPTNWQKKFTSSGHCYFHNTVSGSNTVALPSQWDYDMKGLRLPNGWTRRQRQLTGGGGICLDAVTKSTQSGGVVTYLNAVTKATEYRSPLSEGRTIRYKDYGEVNVLPKDYQYLESDREYFAKPLTAQQWSHVKKLKATSRFIGGF